MTRNGKDDLWVGAFYNPHLGRELLGLTDRIDHLAMADPPRADDPHFAAVRERFVLLLHDYLGQLSEPLDDYAMSRAKHLARLYRSPWVAEHFQCLHTEDGRYNLNYVFPPLYTQEFLERFVTNARQLKLELESELDVPLVMENIPGFFDVGASEMEEPVWLRRFFEATGCGFLLDLPHVWLQAHYRDMQPERWLAEFPLEHVVEIHVAGVEEDEDLEGPWIAPAEPTDEILDLAALAVERCPDVRAVTFDAFSPALTLESLLRTVERTRERLGVPDRQSPQPGA